MHKKLKPRGVNKIVLENTAANETFGKSILSHFRETGPSKVCFKDPVWRSLGLEEYKKLAGIEAKERQAKVRTMTFMNSIATLYGLFSTEAKKKQLDLEFSDMFRPKYLVFLKYVLEDESLKDYNRHMIIYALKNAAEKLKGLYYINDDRQSAAEINELQTVLNIILPPIVNPIVNAQRRRRRRWEILRLPQNLPSLSSITKIKNYIELETEGILEDSENNFDFVALRRLTYTKLVIYQGRRVVEPGLLKITDLEDAKEDKWIDQRSVEKNCNEKERAILEKFKIAFVNMKNSVTKVDVLIPVHALPALEALCNSENRKKSGVLESNNFIFAQVNKAEGQSSGSADLKVIMDKALQFDENHKISLLLRCDTCSPLCLKKEMKMKIQKMFFINILAMTSESIKRFIKHLQLLKLSRVLAHFSLSLMTYAEEVGKKLVYAQN